MRRAFFAVFVLVGLVLSPLTPGSLAIADPVIDPNEVFIAPNDPQPGIQGVLFSDNRSGESGSWLVDNSKRNLNVDPTCKSTEDANCNFSSYQFVATLQQGSAMDAVNCSQEFGSVDASGNRTPATFAQYFPKVAQNQYVGNSAWHLPSGGGGSLYSVPAAKHAGGDNYELQVVMNGGGSSQGGAGTTGLSQFGIKVTPVQVQTMPPMQNYPNWGWANVKNTDGTYTWGLQGPGADGIHYCVAVEPSTSSCAQRFGFPKESRFYVRLKLNLTPAGWLHGRLTNPQMSITTAGDSTILDVEGGTVAVPVLYVAAKWVDLPAWITSQYGVTNGLYKGNGGGFSRIPQWPQSDPTTRNMFSLPLASGASGIEELKLWLPYVNDKATSVPSSWSVRSLDSSETLGSNKCFTDNTKVTGIVTTNSTEYSDGPPTYNQVSGALDYQVAAPHLTATNEVFKGSYDLLMRSEVVRCVYGFSKAPIRASISVLSADGSPEVATTSISEQNGWMHLSANGFEFSAPTVMAKLTQEAPIAVTPVPTPTEKPIAITNPVLPPIMIDPTKIKSVTIKLSGHLVLLVKNPSAWKANLAANAVVRFEKGGSKGTYVANPGFTPVTIGTSSVILSNGAKSFLLRITVTK